ncbi:MAG: saccharopine dehydrogenase NADP-binding domain-containing protein, partial [Marinomonas sp.]
MKILIIGGYGVFGGRLAQLLSDEPRLTLFIAGRTLHKAEQFCAGIEGAATMVPVALDRSNPSEQLASLAPEMVVDATGPFQDYGDDRYALVEAAIAHKIHYLDFADGADFVFGVSRFDAAAKAAGVF